MASPTLSDSMLVEEPEDTVPLSDILSVRDKCLNELELWALCRECCLLLEYVQDSKEMFQAVSITPETIGFDSQGNLCFLYLDSTDPEPLFLSPEIEDGSDKQIEAHLYSLGMTMLYAAEYNTQLSSPPDRGKMSGNLSRSVGRMTADNPTERPNMNTVLSDCDHMLTGESSQEICADVAAICKMKSPQEDNEILGKSNGPTLAEIESQLGQGHVNGVPLHVWSHNEGVSQDSDSELADVFSKTNNNNSKVLVDPNLTQDGILYSASTDPRNNSSLRLTGDQKSQVKTKENLNNISQDSNRITELLDHFTKTSSKLPVRGKGLKKSPVIRDQNYKGDNSSFNSDYHLNGYHSNGLLVLEDDSLMSDSFDLNSSDYYLFDPQDMDRSRKMSQSQGVTLGEALEKKDGYLQEAELWAVCRESIKSLQKLKKRLPAYISPDTLILREEGFVSFKAIPEDKPLEVIFMAPELQEKGLLSQKTCLYGLAITLRSVSGQKFGSSNSRLSSEMDELLESMLKKNLDKRPPLTEVLAVCDDHEQLSDVPSSAICQFIFQDTATAMMESEAELEMSIGGVQTRAAQQQAQLMQQINHKRNTKRNKKQHSEKNSSNKGVVDEDSKNCVRKGMGNSPESINSTNTSFNSSKSSSVSAFKPISGTLSNPAPVRDIKRVPSKYSSTATHFTPIVLQHAGGKETSDKSKKEDSKETDVVKKLKELKENLSKPRNNQNKENGSSKNSTKSSPNPSKTGESPDGGEKSASQVSLETIAHLLQDQGQLAQLNMLAATIAQLLQTSGYSANNNNNVQNTSESQSTNAQIKGHMPLTANMRLPSLDLPQQYQDQFVGQTVTMPIQTSSGIVSNYPIQLQLQQDPQSGLIQLVPVGFVPTPVHSRSSDAESLRSHSRASSKAGRYQVNGRYSSGSDSPAYIKQSDREGFRSLGRPPRSKAYNSRSKESLRKGTPNSNGNIESNLRKAQSAYNLAHIGSPDHFSSVPQGFHSAGHQTGSTPNLIPNGSSSVPGGFIIPVYDDRSADTKNIKNFVTNGGSKRHRSPTDSQSSSPSPSKDSGVSGVNSGGGNNGTASYNLYPKTDVSLIDRLLGHDAMKQQQTLQEVVNLLKLAFSDNSCLESEREDYAMGEYISSLAGLKWETFKCAIEEKYMDLLWDLDVLRQLHYKVNGMSSDSKRSSDVEEYPSHEISGEPVVASTPRNLSLDKPIVAVTKSDSKMSTSSADTNLSEVKSDSAIREPCYRYSPTPRSGLHRFNPSRNLYNAGGDTCTSDSTDTSENHERKRRYKKRHQLNRSKNSSVQSSPMTPNDHSTTTQESNNNESKVDDDKIIPSTPSIKSRDITPANISKLGSFNGSLRSQSSPPLPRLSEKSSSEDVIKGDNQFPVVLEDDDLDPPIIYSVEVGPNTEDIDDTSIQFTSTPYNMAQQGRSACIDREESFQNGSIIKQLSYELDNSLYPDGDKVFVDKKSNGDSKNNVSSSSSAQSIPKGGKHVTVNGDSSSHNKSTGSSSRSEPRNGDSIHRNRGNVVYHSAELQYCMTPQLDHVIQELDPKNKVNLKKRKEHLDQQVMMERRTKKKMQQFYKKLVDGKKPVRGDQKSMLAQVSKDIKDMTSRLKLMELAWGHVEMLLTELSGINPALLHSLSVHSSIESLSLTPSSENPLLQYQIHHDNLTALDLRVLQAGTPQALVSYLFTMSALVDGYIHQFLYTFRYLTSQMDLLTFLMEKYIAAKRNMYDTLNEKVMVRAADLLYFWLEGYYTIDFEKDSELCDKLQEFIINEVMYPEGSGAKLLGLLQDCNHGNNTELSFTEAVITDQIDLLMRQDDGFSPKKLSGFKAIMKSSPTKSSNPAIISTAILESRLPGNSQEELYVPHIARRCDAFTVTDHSSQSLAEQLSLMQQVLFQKCHPVHYLNTKAQGIGVAMTSSTSGFSTINRSRNNNLNDSELTDPGLFEGTFYPNPVLQRLIKSAQEISHWVAAEIVTCSSTKSQLSVLTKLIYTAQTCMQMRNFAISVAISDGLENLIVRQLPVWKNLPSKCIAIKEELASMKMLLKNEPLCLVEDKEFRDHPTIPSILLFIMHVQQLEIGGFTLANGMFKWPKLRSLAQMVDQIRMFKDQTYQFDLDNDLHDTLRHRIHELCCQDLQNLASQHDTNYHKVSSRGIFSRMKGKFQNKS